MYSGKFNVFWKTIKEYVCHHKNTVELTEHEYVAEGILAQSDVALSVSIWCGNIDIQHPGRSDQKYKSPSDSVTQKHDQRIKVYRCFGSPPISFHARFDTTLYSSRDYTILNKNVYEIDSDSQFRYEQIEGMPHANCVAYIQQERQRTSDALRRRLEGWNAFSATRPRNSTGRMVSGCLSQPVTHNSSEKDKSQFNKVHKKHVFTSSMGLAYCWCTTNLMYEKSLNVTRVIRIYLRAQELLLKINRIAFGNLWKCGITLP